ncbi:hypothetical protein [Nocardia xishanensis]|uniref:hypothetical protein n=1 Tax=Nocardia xishanensis TaxID=238964 RepID=UPI00083480D5|nr:hypothetical protein [Nocardia xishanensis]
MSGDFVKVDIVLPLPLDVAATLINLIGTAYPGAQMDASGGRDGWGREVMRMQIPSAERYASAAARDEIQAAKRVVEDERETMLASVRDGIAVSTPEEIQHQLGYLCSRFFLDNPAAVNYVEVEMDVQNRDTRERFVLTVRRAEGKTPHALRKEAEAEVERLRARLAELEAAA